MDSQTLIVFTVDIQAQMALIKGIYEKLVIRSKRLQPDDEIVLESIAYQIHNLYSATEELMKIVTTYFENNINESNQWHSLLLQRMKMDIPEIRPALLSTETYSILNSLRGFRHFFRHAYGATLEYEPLKTNLDKSLKLFPQLKSDVNQFIFQLSESDSRVTE
ncbi:hypothetical protein J0895_03575 [Phormidium pseudopriestleyi FRX01]|uniref:HepT-like domain-containing protein n=1 Tax=Phormidium pseudopriestleyi FRX01 TaxID=1759528 RepID=A0ABS3FMS5_9CYAN|nr:hypothetical protein [Phormidium pseudopriestleyi]MBO0348197.1 hypothetical protein [Phormidium pseudopriestleyi FRX01]